MRRRDPAIHSALAAVVSLAVLGCEARKSENPLSPTVAGPIAGVEITPPRLLEPAQGFRFKENQQPIRLVIENAATNGVRPLSYAFEVASDSAFGTKVFTRTGVPPGEGGRTVVQLEPLELGKPYYWRARAEDGANTGAFATAHFEVLPRAMLTVPGTASPTNNERVGSRRPTLRVDNSDRNAAVGSVRYVFVVAKDQAFTQVVAAGEVDEGHPTTWTVDRDLDYNLTHYWRARASDGEVTTGWSGTQMFMTPLAPAGGGGAPGPAPGGPCNSSNPLTIVQCERAKYGFMSKGQMVEFLRSTARSLNRNGISGGPFGILRKSSGNNCGGYSCDVLCAGQGGSQRQWDVLGDIEDAQYPAWGGPNGPGGIRVDRCEIQ